MAAISSCKILGFDYSLSSVPKTQIKNHALVCSVSCSQFSRPNFGPICKPLTLSSSRISYHKKKGLEQWSKLPQISCLLEDSHEASQETDHASISNNSQQEAAIDLKLPRRSLLVTFTCDACGVRSQRLINRLAYERGLVYVQCSGCSQYHKLVDNLGLVVEYTFHEEIDLDTRADQV